MLSRALSRSTMRFITPRLNRFVAKKYRTKKSSSIKEKVINTEKLKENIISFKKAYYENMKFGFTNGYSIYDIPRMNYPKYFKGGVSTTVLGLPMVGSVSVFTIVYNQWKESSSYTSSQNLGNLVVYSAVIGGLGGWVIGFIAAPFWPLFIPGISSYLLLTKVKIHC